MDLVDFTFYNMSSKEEDNYNLTLKIPQESEKLFKVLNQFYNNLISKLISSKYSEKNDVFNKLKFYFENQTHNSIQVKKLVNKIDKILSTEEKSYSKIDEYGDYIASLISDWSIFQYDNNNPEKKFTDDHNDIFKYETFSSSGTSINIYKMLLRGYDRTYNSRFHKMLNMAKISISSCITTDGEIYINLSDANDLLETGYVIINRNNNKYYIPLFDNKTEISDFISGILLNGYYKKTKPINIINENEFESVEILFEFSSSNNFVDYIENNMINRITPIIENLIIASRKSYVSNFFFNNGYKRINITTIENEEIERYDKYIEKSVEYFKKICKEKSKSVDLYKDEEIKKIRSYILGNGEKVIQINKDFIVKSFSSNGVTIKKEYIDATEINLSKIKKKDKVKNKFSITGGHDNKYTLYHSSQKIKDYFYSINKPFVFFDYENNNEELNLDNLSTEEAINRLSVIGNILGKFVLSNYILFNEVDSQKEDDYTNMDKVFTVETLGNYDYFNYVKIDNVEYDNPYDAYKCLWKELNQIFNQIIDSLANEIKNEDRVNDILEQSKSFNDYLVDRMNNFGSEKDYFYINTSKNRKMTPMNTFVDIEFRVPVYENGSINLNKEAWIPVSSKRSYTEGSISSIGVNTDDNDTSEDTKMYAGTYFNSFELEDKEGVKTITLTLKSPDDINLEKIIFNSLSMDYKSIISNNTNANSIDDYEKILNQTSSNFRIRFGYRDIVPKDQNNEDTVISSSVNTSSDFLKRTKVNKERGESIKPVLVYPWTYFKITDIESSIISNENTYTITAASSGSYILDNLCLQGINSNFSNETIDVSNTSMIGTPKNVVGKIAEWLLKSSKNRICFLGGSENSIITSVNSENEKIIENMTYELKQGGYLSPSDIDTMENCFFGIEKNGSIESARNFNISNNSKMYSISELLNKLVSWLPSRIYAIHKLKDYPTVATYLPYSSIQNIHNFFSTVPFKSEQISYQVIEADAKIYDKNSSKLLNKDFEKTYFIRLYYKGPGKSGNSNGEFSTDEYLRVYNYKSFQNQLIENLNISSSSSSGNFSIGNIVSSVTVLGNSKPMVFTFDNNSMVMSDVVTDANNKENSLNASEYEKAKNEAWDNFFGKQQESNDNPYLAAKSVTILNNINKDDDSVILSSSKERASAFFTSMQNQAYIGEMTILGDPFYYFDSELQAGKYEIYLQMNRVEDLKNSARYNSFFSGIYTITGIKHSIDETGKYTTTLSIAKRVFPSNDD